MPTPLERKPIRSTPEEQGPWASLGGSSQCLYSLFFCAFYPLARRPKQWQSFAVMESCWGAVATVQGPWWAEGCSVAAPADTGS